MRLFFVITVKTVTYSGFRYRLGVFVLVRCEMFAYRYTVTHEPLNVSYFSELVWCSVLY